MGKIFFTELILISGPNSDHLNPNRRNEMHSLYTEKRYKNGRAIADSAIVALKASFVSRHHTVR
jgi:hypothetical protein